MSGIHPSRKSMILNSRSIATNLRYRKTTSVYRGRDGFRGLLPRPHREEVGTSAFAMTIGSPRGQFKKNPSHSDKNHTATRRRRCGVSRAHIGSDLRHTNQRPPPRHIIVKPITVESLDRRIDHTLDKRGSPLPEMARRSVDWQERQLVARSLLPYGHGFARLS